MAKCDRCLWGDQCFTPQTDCGDYTPVDEHEALEELIEDGLSEFRRLWLTYIRENEVQTYIGAKHNL